MMNVVLNIVKKHRCRGSCSQFVYPQGNFEEVQIMIHYHFINLQVEFTEIPAIFDWILNILLNCE